MELRIGLVSTEFEGTYIDRLDRVESCLQEFVSLGLLCFGTLFFGKEEAIHADSKEILLLRDLAMTYNCGIGLGYIEKDEDDSLHRSYIIISDEGDIVAKHKTPLIQQSSYALLSVTYKELKFLIIDEEALNSTEVCLEINRQNPDVVLAQTSIVHNSTNWRNQGLGNFASELININPSIMIVNSFDSEDPQKTGGAYLIKKGEVVKELPLGNKGILIVNENEL